MRRHEICFYAESMGNYLWYPFFSGAPLLEKCSKQPESLISVYKQFFIHIDRNWGFRLPCAIQMQRARPACISRYSDQVFYVPCIKKTDLAANKNEDGQAALSLLPLLSTIFSLLIM